MENETSLVKEKSYVDEFLTRALQKDGDYLIDSAVDRMSWTDFQNFCKELNFLREMSKLVNDYKNYLHTKHEI